MFADPRCLFLAAWMLARPAYFAKVDAAAAGARFNDVDHPPIGATPADRTPDPEPEPDVWLGEN